MNRTRAGALVALLGIPAFGGGCASSNQAKTGDQTAAQAGSPDNRPTEMVADRSRCDGNGKRTMNLDLNKDGRADVTKFIGTATEQGTTIEVLTCKEVDLNFDGHKDMWVYYDNAGNVTLEEFDLDFDGKIDMWTYRQGGRVVRQEMDTNFDGKPDIWKFFEAEKLVRLERSTRRDGHIDVWEYYEGGKLDRIGYDTSGSGHADKWDRAPDEPSQQEQPPTSTPAAAPTTSSSKAAPPTPPTATPTANEEK